jgi:hypothetical protein
VVAGVSFGLREGRVVQEAFHAFLLQQLFVMFLHACFAEQVPADY